MKTVQIFVCAFLLSLLFCLLPSRSVFASDLVQKSNGTKCLDLEAAYAEINNSSQALTNNNNGVDAVKKADMLATLANVTSFFLGDQIYCVKDKVAASKVSGFEKYGLLGQIQNANTNLLSSFPTMNVGSNLAEMFIPGYNNNNSALAAEEEATNPCQLENDTYKNCLANASSVGDACSVEEDAYISCYQSHASEVTGSSSVFDGLQGVAGNEISNGITEEMNNADTGENTATEVTGSGYQYLKENVHLDGMWSFSRNLAYLGFVIVVIVAGFMIMFRKNIGGQVLVSIGNSVPNLIIGIILVTFSFAITGLLMDLGKVAINVTQNVFTEVARQEGDDALASGDIIKTDDVGTLFSSSFSASTTTGSKIAGWLGTIPVIGNGIKNIMGQATSMEKLSAGIKGLFKGAKTASTVEKVDLDSGIPGAEIAVTLGEIALDLLLSAVEFGLISALIKIIIIAAICLYASVRLFITIIVTYFKLLISVVIAPVQILMGSLPGNSGMIVSWFKGLAANILTFVAIVFVINFFNYIATVVDPSNFNFFGNTGLIWPNWLIPLKGVIVIGGYLFAASLPGVINGLLKVEQNRELATAGMDVKKAISKIPLIGNAFGG